MAGWLWVRVRMGQLDPLREAAQLVRSLWVTKTAEVMGLYAEHQECTTPGWFIDYVDGPTDRLIELARAAWDAGFAGFEVDVFTQHDYDLWSVCAVPSIHVTLRDSDYELPIERLAPSTGDEYAFTGKLLPGRENCEDENRTEAGDIQEMFRDK